MKKLLLLFSILSVFVACSGNPPKWWNPSNAYVPTTDTSTKSSAVKIQSASTTPAQQIMQPSEETITLPDESYEEMNLTPLAEDLSENIQTSSLASTPIEKDDSQENLPIPSVLE